jgi:hypothetical protein
MSERQPPPRVGRSIGAVLAGIAMPCAWAGAANSARCSCRNASSHKKGTS